jgi:hypothetical protein
MTQLSLDLSIPGDQYEFDLGDEPVTNTITITAPDTVNASFTLNSSYVGGSTITVPTNSITTNSGFNNWLTTQENSTLTADDLEVQNDILIGGKSVNATLEAICKHLGVIVPKEGDLDTPGLKDLYEKYEILSNLVKKS